MKSERQKVLKLLAAMAAALILAILAFSVSPQAQENGDDEDDTTTVTESEIDTYIKVYTAMQADHALKLEDALKPHEINLRDFRNLERRIQREQRYVDKVRKELLDHAKSRLHESEVPPGAAPGPTSAQP